MLSQKEAILKCVAHSFAFNTVWERRVSWQKKVSKHKIASGKVKEISLESMCPQGMCE